MVNQAKATEKEWSRFECEITMNGTDFRGDWHCSWSNLLTIDFDMISLFPKETFLGRKNGLRMTLLKC